MVWSMTTATTIAAPMTTWFQDWSISKMIMEFPISLITIAPSTAPSADPRAPKPIVAGAAGETGYAVRFLSAAEPADAPVVKSAIDAALGDGLQLACPVVSGSPLGYEFCSPSVKVRVPLEAGTGKVAKVLTSDDADGARWKRF